MAKSKTSAVTLDEATLREVTVIGSGEFDHSCPASLGTVVAIGEGGPGGA